MDSPFWINTEIATAARIYGCAGDLTGLRRPAGLLMAAVLLMPPERMFRAPHPRPHNTSSPTA
jgi:hypothetical protein